jgi:hypothetical protein
VDDWSLTEGIRVELEHTSSREVAACIRNVHLHESLRYYHELAKLERWLKRSKRRK